MSSSFSSLKFELIGTGEQSGIWGTTTNTNIGTAIEQAIVGMATLEAGDFTANVCTLTLANTNAAQDARALCLKIDSAALSAAGTVNVPAIQKPYLIINDATHAVTVKVSGQTGVTVPAGSRTVVYNDGTDIGNQISWLSSLTLGTALPLASGGTGATAAPAARTNLGATTVGGNLFTLPNPSAIRYIQLNADNTVTVMDAAAFRTAIGASASGGGTVTSVSGTGTINGLTLTGTVTSSGSLTLGGAFRFNVQVIGTNTAAAANNVYVVTVSGVTVTLPGSPTAGDFVGVSNMSGATNITIARNGNNIMALAEDLTVNLSGAGFMLVYADATRGWVLMP